MTVSKNHFVSNKSQCHSTIVILLTELSFERSSSKMTDCCASPFENINVLTVVFNWKQCICNISWFLIWKGVNRQAVVKFPQNLFKQEVKYYDLRSINSLIPFGIRKNCLISWRSVLLYQFTRMVITLTVIIIMGYHCYQLHTTFYSIFYSQG
jgi:hypothetical protein